MIAHLRGRLRFIPWVSNVGDAVGIIRQRYRDECGVNVDIIYMLKQYRNIFIYYIIDEYSPTPPPPPPPPPTQ
jgi:hypothetical protein